RQPVLEGLASLRQHLSGHSRREGRERRQRIPYAVDGLSTHRPGEIQRHGDRGVGDATNTWDTPIHWQKDMVLRDGYGFVWISNQDMTISGANGLKAWSPKRYGNLDVTNGGTFQAEELSWDIFSQVAKAVRADPQLMGGMPVKKVLAVGESQSAMRLSIYLNSIHPLTGNIY